MAKAKSKLILYCCGCDKDVAPVLITGADVYPHRKDLHGLPFWRCEACKNFVGCHHKTKNPTAPLGCIPTPQVKEIRKRVHFVLDPLWKKHGHERGELYNFISERIGKTYHTANIRSVAEGEKIIGIVAEIKASAAGYSKS